MNMMNMNTNMNANTNMNMKSETVVCNEIKVKISQWLSTPELSSEIFTQIFSLFIL